jgi:hypothetical protein
VEAGSQWKFSREGFPVPPVFCVLMNSRIVILGFALVAPLLTGCTSAPSAPTAGQHQAAQPVQQDPWQFLAKGTTAEQVRAALGTPVEVRPMQAPGAEVWIYRRTAAMDIGLVPARMEEIPIFDPTSGQPRMVPNPVYSQETRTVEEELQLLLFEGRLVTWKRAFRTERSYH